MRIIQFSMYYIKLRLTVLVGLYETSLPMDANWRWHFWQERYRAQHSRLSY